MKAKNFAPFILYDHLFDHLLNSIHKDIIMFSKVLSISIFIVLSQYYIYFLKITNSLNFLRCLMYSIPKGLQWT